MSNEQTAKRTKEILGDLGYEIPLGHAYELLARLAGHKSYNIAKTKEAALDLLARPVERLYGPEEIKTVMGGGKQFSVKIKAFYDGEVSKFYSVSAESPQQAREIMQQYLEIQHGNREPETATFPQVKALLLKENDGDFQWQNWEMIDSVGYEAEVSEIYPK